MENEIQKVETEVKDVIAEVKDKLADVYHDAKKFETAAIAAVKTDVAKVKEIVQELSGEEKLVLREIEVIFLKAQADFNKSAQTIKEAQQKYNAILDAICKKYVIIPSEWAWDNVQLLFKKL